jgi:8-oxo-dGTP pyrophosphatase MutT (NUDIX family)
LQALCREIKEELNLVLKEDELIYYTHITAPAYDENTDVTMEQACFMANKCLYPKASAEIGKIRYFGMDEYLKEKFQAPGAIMILQKLQPDNLIN